jgi:hypothetical protein
VDEFLEKLAEDQRRMRKYLRGQGARFMKIGKALAGTRERGARIFVVGEPPLDGLMPVIADEYLQQLPALALRLEDTAGAPAPDEGGELDPQASSGQGPPLVARHLARHFRSGDALLVVAHSGHHAAVKALMGFASLKGVYTVLVGGLDAREALRKAADTALTLPTRGVKTVCEASFVVARILARCARAQMKELKVEEDAKLIRVECGSCREPVFVEERTRGKKASCPLCRAALLVPEGSGERGPSGPSVPWRPAVSHEPPQEASAVTEGTSDRLSLPSESRSGSSRALSSRRKPKKPLKQSVLNLPVPQPEVELDPEPEPDERQASERAAAIVGAAGEATSAGGADAFEELPPVGLSSKDDPHETVIAPEDVAFDEFAAATESADPFALPDAFVADLVMPQGRPDVKGAPPPSDANPILIPDELPGSSHAPGSASSSRRGPPSSRLVSSRFTVQDCRLRFGRGGYPDESSPEHPLEALSASRLVFSLDPDDDLGSTLEKGDELWVRLSVPAFLEPVLARGTITRIGGSASPSRGTQIEIEWKELDATVSRKLARAAETLATA